MAGIVIKESVYIQRLALRLQQPLLYQQQDLKSPKSCGLFPFTSQIAIKPISNASNKEYECSNKGKIR